MVTQGAITIVIHFGLIITLIDSRKIVTLSFYEMNEHKWANAAPSFYDVISHSANHYCRSHPSECGLADRWNEWSFTASSVLVDSTKSDDDKKNAFEVEFYVEYNQELPSNYRLTSGTGLSQNTLEDIVTEYRDTIHDDVGYFLLTIGDSDYHPPPNTSQNQIIICVAFLIVFVLVMIVVWYQVKGCREEKEWIRRRHLQLHLKNSRTSVVKRNFSPDEGLNDNESSCNTRISIISSMCSTPASNLPNYIDSKENQQTKSQSLGSNQSLLSPSSALLTPVDNSKRQSYYDNVNTAGHSNGITNSTNLQDSPMGGKTEEALLGTVTGSEV